MDKEPDQPQQHPKEIDMNAITGIAAASDVLMNKIQALTGCNDEVMGLLEKLYELGRKEAIEAVKIDLAEFGETEAVEIIKANYTN